MNGVFGFGLSLLGVLIAGSLIFAGALKIHAYAQRRRFAREQRDRAWIRDRLTYALRDIQEDDSWR